MGRFGSKKDEGEEDSNRLGLFGSRSKNSKSPAPPPAAENPYANPVIPPDPYTRAKMNLKANSAMYQQPPPGDGAPGQMGQGAYGAAPPGRGGGNPYGVQSNNPYGGAPPSSGYSGERYGNQGGYGGSQGGGNPYASVVQPSGVARTGGYGGLGPAQDDPEANAARDELFGGARERQQQQETNNMNYAPQEPNDRSYGAYGDRQLTAEEEEEEDVQAMKQEMRQMKQSDVNSTRNAMRMVEQSLETGNQTLALLGEQGERLHKTENNMDMGQNRLNIAEDQAKELKTLNRSIFAVHVNNPFTAKDRKAKRDADLLQRHQMERDQREATRDETFKSTQRMNQHFKTLEDEQRIGTIAPPKKTNYAERAKYQFDADSDDDRMEDEIDHNLDQLAKGMGQLNMLAKATGKEVEAQNSLIHRLAEKSDKMDDRLHMQTERLKRIH